MRFGLVALCAVLAALPSGSARGDEEKAKSGTAQPAWCAPEYDALSDGMCHVGSTDGESRRTLVIFLHGAIAKDVTWQHTQERALARQAKQSHFEAIFPRSPLTPGGYVWPGSVATQEAVETDIIASWTRARRTLEARNKKP